mmetsp:Transcript_28278/g.40260  ORF Transcript_28278/g.40260 Transcript_28278/m.40260 type:complete len:90 (+) Transcript_28278:1004-1273(+)
MVHPSQHDCMVTSSRDGTVKCFNTSSTSSATLTDLNPTNNNNNSSNSSSTADCVTLAHEPSAIMSIDCEIDSAMILAVTSTGGLLRMHL